MFDMFRFCKPDIVSQHFCGDDARRKQLTWEWIISVSIQNKTTKTCKYDTLSMLNHFLRVFSKWRLFYLLKMMLFRKSIISQKTQINIFSVDGD